MARKYSVHDVFFAHGLRASHECNLWAMCEDITAWVWQGTLFWKKYLLSSLCRSHHLSSITLLHSRNSFIALLVPQWNRGHAVVQASITHILHYFHTSSRLPPSKTLSPTNKCHYYQPSVGQFSVMFADVSNISWAWILIALFITCSILNSILNSLPSHKPFNHVHTQKNCWTALQILTNS